MKGRHGAVFLNLITLIYMLIVFGKFLLMFLHLVCLKKIQSMD
jgi:hypothetical protein